MNILIVLTKEFSAGGGQSHIINLSAGLVAEEHQVTVAAGEGALTEELRASGARFYRLYLCRAVNLLGLIIQIFVAVKRVKPDIIHAQSGIALTVCLPIAKLTHTPCVVTYHGFSPHSYSDRTTSALLQKIIAVSGYYKNKLLKVGHLKAEQIAVIPNGIDFEKYALQSDEGEGGDVGFKPDSYKVIYISRLSKEKAGLYDKWKQITQVLEAITLVYKLLPSVQLLVVGGGDAFLDTQRKAEEINRKVGADLIMLAGTRYDIPRIIRSGDVVLGLGRVVLEALACEQVTICMQKGEFGGAITPDKVDALEKNNFSSLGGREAQLMAQDIIEVLKNREFYLDLTVKAKERVFAIANIHHVARRTVEVYLEAIHQQRTQKQSQIVTASWVFAMLCYKIVQYLGKERLR